MAKIISASINCSKITKAKLIDGKNGAKYCNIDIIINDEKDQYGNDVSISESQPKEDREAKVPKVYLGNGRTVWEKQAEQSAPTQSQSNEEPDTLPF